MGCLKLHTVNNTDLKISWVNKCVRSEKSEKKARSVYLFGFNGQEKDDEVYGSDGTSYTAEYWQYDSRLGRRWNIDPVVKPWESPYACFNNSPIRIADPDGDEGKPVEDTPMDSKITSSKTKVKSDDEKPDIIFKIDISNIIRGVKKTLGIKNYADTRPNIGIAIARRVVKKERYVVKELSNVVRTGSSTLDLDLPNIRIEYNIEPDNWFDNQNTLDVHGENTPAGAKNATKILWGSAQGTRVDLEGGRSETHQEARSRRGSSYGWLSGHTTVVFTPSSESVRYRVVVKQLQREVYFVRRIHLTRLSKAGGMVDRTTQ
jgi:hypothetical protein